MTVQPTTVDVEGVSIVHWETDRLRQGFNPWTVRTGFFAERGCEELSATDEHILVDIEGLSWLANIHVDQSRCKADASVLMMLERFVSVDLLHSCLCRDTVVWDAL